MFAVVPVLIAAVVNTGYQYLLALEVVGGEGAGGWRDAAARALGADYSDPSAAGIVAAGLVHVLPVLGMAMLVGGLWERVFANSRRRRFDTGVFVTALVFTLLMPPAVSLAHVVFGMSFAIVFGKGVFGGEGKTFLNPALLGAAVMQISFPTALSDHPLWTGIAGYEGTKALALYQQNGSAGFAWADMSWWDAFLGATQGMMGATSVLAVLVGGVALVLAGIASWRLVLAQVLGLVVAATFCNMLGEGIFALPWHWHLVLGSFAFGAVFVATDPGSSASTEAGRWAQGLLMGALVVMIRV
ncbi:MAG: RnfABCDGE type electron transport complex subunit D, partial [Gammaproteobacteria bacterium]